ncbi:MAG: alpha/beta fold hydrolase, partial [Candidatus Hydrogenedentales bacterium]
LVREGFAVIVVDLPGHGASPGEWREKQEWGATADGLEDAARSLRDSGADPSRIAYIGAGFGANLALTSAQQTGAAAAVALVSPGWEIQGVDVRGAVGALSQRPVLLMAAEGDSYAAATVNGMKAEAPGFCELRLYPGTAHGTKLLDTSEHAREQLIEWLKLVLADE